MDKGALRPGVTWVTSTRRLAHYLRGRHDSACLGRGLDVWPTPDILTWDELIERMFELDRQAGRLRVRWLHDAAASLVWQRIVESDPASEEIVSPGLLGRAAQESWRRLHAYEIPLDALREGDNPETRIFARWCEDYARWLQRHGWVDPEQAPALLSASSAGTELELVGFDVLTPAQARFVERLSSAGVVVRRRDVPDGGGAVSRATARDRDGEVEMAARWAAGWLHRDATARLAIVVPQLASRRETVRRIVARVIAPATTFTGGPAPESQAFEVSAARSLAAYPLAASGLAALGAFVHGGDLGRASQLLLDPYLAGDDSEAPARARLDARIRRYEGPDLGLERLARLAERDCPRLATALQSGLARSREWPRRALPSSWSRAWFELLGAIAWPEVALDSEEHQVRQRWRELLTAFGASDDYVGALGAREALGLLTDAASSALFAPQQPGAPLLVIDPDSCAGMHFDGLWVCGLDSTQWPAPVSPDPFLPRDWQARQEVPGATASIAADEARRTLDRLRASAGRVVLSVPQFDGEAPLLASPLVAGIEAAPLEGCWTAPLPAEAEFAAQPEIEELFDGEMPALPHGTASRGGTKLLELQSACPFRAQVELRLGARPLEDTELGIVASDRGELVHDVQARLWREVRDLPTLRALAPERRRELVRAAIAQAVEPLRAVADGVMRRLLDLEGEWLEARAMELLGADLARPDFVVEGVEQSSTVEIGGLVLSLKLDRVDRLADGSFAVIDYKTGADAEPKSWSGERPKLPQLPLYAEAVGPAQVAAVAFARVRSGKTGYAGLARRDGLLPGLGVPGGKGWPKEFDSWAALAATWRRRLEALAAEHAAGDARLAPDPVRACQYCPQAGLCRIGETRLGTADEDGDDD